MNLTYRGLIVGKVKAFAWRREPIYDEAGNLIGTKWEYTVTVEPADGNS